MSAQRILVTGASGQVGAWLVRKLVRDGRGVAAWTHTFNDDLFGLRARQVDLADPDSLTRAIEQDAPDTLVHLGAVTSVAAAQADPALARRVNVHAALHLAELMRNRRGRMIYCSTDMVFDGRKGNYHETDAPAPLSTYGQTKLEAEQALQSFDNVLTIRPALLFGPILAGKPKFFDAMLTALRNGQPFSLFHDEYRTPLSNAMAADPIAALIDSDHTGLLHLAGPDRLSRLDMGRQLARVLGVSDANLTAISRLEHAGDQPRPADLSLNAGKWRAFFPDIPWRSYDEELRRMLTDA